MCNTTDQGQVELVDIKMFMIGSTLDACVPLALSKGCLAEPAFGRSLKLFINLQ